MSRRAATLLFAVVFVALGALVLPYAWRRFELHAAEADTMPPGDLHLTREFDATAEPSLARADALLPCDEVWDVEALTLSESAREEIDVHWRGWRVRAWRVHPSVGRVVPMILFDARRPREVLLRAELAPSTEPYDLAFAWTPTGSDSRSAYVQFLRFAGRRVQVLASAEVRGDSAPPFGDTLLNAKSLGGSRPYCARRDPPDLASVSWCGYVGAALADRQLWPRRGMRYLTADLDERGVVVAPLPLRDWPWPVWFVSFELADVLDLPDFVIPMGPEPWNVRPR